MIASELVLGDEADFVERIPLFLELLRFLETPAVASSPFYVRSNVIPPVFEPFLTVPTGDPPVCIAADNLKGVKLLALEFKCDRLLTRPNISADADCALTQHENIIELLPHVSDLPLPKRTRAWNHMLRHCLMVQTYLARHRSNRVEGREETRKIGGRLGKDFIDTGGLLHQGS
jgi:hypothetical protein